jgi:predicted phage-related endonuclease
MILETGHKFWHDHVLPQRIPAPDGTDDAWKMIREKYPKPRIADLIVATSAWDAKAREALEMAEQRKYAEREEKRLKQELAIMLGDWPGVRGDGWRALWQERAAYHVPAHDVEPNRILDLRPVKTEAEKAATKAAKKGKAA